MAIRLGKVDYLNCLPVYYALEEGRLPFSGAIKKGPPTRLNSMFLSGELDVTPISSIEYARNSKDCVILPGVSISADGRVESILFFSRGPVTGLEGKRVAVTTSSATSVALLKILMEHYFKVKVEFVTHEPDLEKMMKNADGALLIGDDAMISKRMVLQEGLGFEVTDLGVAWKELTGKKMVYAVWVAKRKFALEHPEELDHLNRLLRTSLEMGMSDPEALIRKAGPKTGLPRDVLEDYFQTIRYGFDESYRQALSLYYDYAYKDGLISEPAGLNVWGGER
ncbi:MAG: menaquinone biosynthetic enzyme MqnA/MqnD family protein [Bacillota bacterium]